MKEFNKTYQNVLEKILRQKPEINKRTREEVKALPGVHFIVKPKEGFPLLSLRKISVKSFVTETVWFLTGERTTKFLDKHNIKIWKAFRNISGIVPVAYGWRWRHAFRRNQIQDLVKLLKEDSSSRQGVVLAWDPSEDGLMNQGRRSNVPCPFCFVVNIINGKLNLFSFIRSNDMIAGFPFDAADFALLQLLFAKAIGAKLGEFHHIITHAHIYERHYKVAETLIERSPSHPPLFFETEARWLDMAMSSEEEADKVIEEAVPRIQANYHPLPAINIGGIAK